jgi:hypothetical protein
MQAEETKIFLHSSVHLESSIMHFVSTVQVYYMLVAETSMLSRVTLWHKNLCTHVPMLPAAFICNWTLQDNLLCHVIASPLDDVQQPNDQMLSSLR